MGHLGHLKQEYRELARRLQVGQVGYAEPQQPDAWQGWKEILEILYTPEEAALAARMPILPTRLEKLARRFGMPQEELARRLDAMCDKGVVFDVVNPKTGAVKYLLAPPVVGFFEFSLMRAHDSIPKKRISEAFEAYTRGDMTFALEAFGKETVIGRALVHETAAESDKPEVLEWQKATAIIEGARALAVSLCFCRHKAEHLGRACDTERENCLSLNGGAEFVIRRKFGRAIDRKEALDILARAREAGLVQIADNVQSRPIYICNCCGCCCEQLQAVSKWGLPAVNPSGFTPARNAAACKGCSRCARACPVAAVTMKPRREQAALHNQLEPDFDMARCIGCGVCADACRNHALTMQHERTPRVPKNAVERVLRMALERGKLPHLLAETASRGNGLLAPVLRGLLALAPVDRLLASEQLRSRFISAAMTRIKDPTGDS